MCLNKKSPVFSICLLFSNPNDSIRIISTRPMIFPGTMGSIYIDIAAPANVTAKMIINSMMIVTIRSFAVMSEALYAVQGGKIKFLCKSHR